MEQAHKAFIRSYKLTNRDKSAIDAGFATAAYRIRAKDGSMLNHLTASIADLAVLREAELKEGYNVGEITVKKLRGILKLYGLQFVGGPQEKSNVAPYSIRDRFAAAALSSINMRDISKRTCRDAAKIAYMMADAMMEERK